MQTLLYMSVSILYYFITEGKILYGPIRGIIFFEIFPFLSVFYTVGFVIIAECHMLISYVRYNNTGLVCLLAGS